MGTDSLYYIMDYSGNYYRTDKADQLVAVAGEQDATVFTFAQANSRICVGKKASFYCMVPIEETEEDMNGTVSGSDEIDDNSGALPVEEQENNDDHQQERLVDGLFHLVDRSAYEARIIIGQTKCALFTNEMCKKKIFFHAKLKAFNQCLNSV